MTHNIDTRRLLAWLLASLRQGKDWLAECRDNVVVLLLFCAIATVFQLYLGGDMRYEIGRTNPMPTLLPTQGINNFPHHTDIV